MRFLQIVDFENFDRGIGLAPVSIGACTTSLGPVLN